MRIPIFRLLFSAGLGCALCAAQPLELKHLRLLLRRAPEREQAAREYLDRLQEPGSPDFHRWLTPREVGERFGATEQAVDTVAMWLGAHGLQVEGVNAARTAVAFSGTAAQVGRAFQTEIRGFEAKGREHWAAAWEARIPAELTGIVAGVAKLNDFQAHAAYRTGSRMRKSSESGKWQPVADDTLSYSNMNFYLVAPYDFATIYNLLPLWNAGTTGQGQTIALVEDSLINADDVAAFRLGLGLPALANGQLQIVCATGTDCTTTADETEGAIDAEWSGAAAPAANILYVAADTLEDAASYIVENNVAPVVSISFSMCEADLGPGGNLFWSGLWQTAALQGQTVIAAAGDSGGAVCDADLNPGAAQATLGLSVNGIASTPDDIAIGGTDFSDTFAGTETGYWAASNAGGTLESALSYVPEMTWNNSCASNVLSGFLGFPEGEAVCEVLPYFFGTNPLSVLNIVAGSGGASTLYTKPTWQANVAGLANDGVRDLPDVALFASDNAWSHAYIYCMSDAAQGGNACDYTNAGDTFFNSGGGTSFAAPAFAGIMALIGQQTGSAQGNVNYTLYGLAGAEYGTAAAPNTQAMAACNAGQGNEVSSTCVFYDVTQGDTTVPCATGSPNCFTAQAGDAQGVLSTSATALAAAFTATTGWDFATGIGSVNAANLATGWGSLSQDYVISGQVTLNGAALAGAAVTLTGGRTGKATTNSAGKFTFVVPGKNTYTVTPAANGYTFTPPTQSFQNLSGNRSANFSGTGSLPLVKLSTSSMNFGNENAGVASGTQSVVLTNIGNGPLTIATVAMSGANAGDFKQTNTCGSLPAQIAVNGSCTVQVGFDPSMAGAEAATLTFTDNANAKTGSTQTVGLSGMGVVNLSLTPASLNFSYQGVGEASTAKTVQIVNSSAIGVTVSKIAVTGANAADFTVKGVCGSLAAGAKCGVSVVFDPAATGARSASLSLTDNATGSPQAVALSGTGTEKAVIELSKTSLSFPATPIGQSSAPQTLTVSNGGHGSLTINGIGASDGFSETNNCTAAMSAGQSCTVTVTFAPTLTGARTGTLTVSGNGVVFNQTARLSGTGE